MVHLLVEIGSCLKQFFEIEMSACQIWTAVQGVACFNISIQWRPVEYFAVAMQCMCVLILSPGRSCVVSGSVIVWDWSHLVNLRFSRQSSRSRQETRNGLLQRKHMGLTTHMLTFWLDMLCVYMSGWQFSEETLVRVPNQYSMWLSQVITSNWLLQTSEKSLRFPFFKKIWKFYFVMG